MPPGMKDRLEALLQKYGKLALIIYFTIFGLVLTGFALAIRAGVQVESAAGEAGTLGAAWVATKLTQPLRILATVVLTPLVSKLVDRFRKAPPPTT